MSENDTSQRSTSPAVGRYTRRDERRVYVEAWRRSGLSRRAFARQHGISHATFGHWVRQEEAPTGITLEPAGFVAALPPALSADDVGELRWELPHGAGTLRGSTRAMLPVLLAALGQERS